MRRNKPPRRPVDMQRFSIGEGKYNEHFDASYSKGLILFIEHLNISIDKQGKRELMFGCKYEQCYAI